MALLIIQRGCAPDKNPFNLRRGVNKQVTMRTNLDKVTIEFDNGSPFSGDRYTFGRNKVCKPKILYDQINFPKSGCAEFTYVIKGKNGKKCSDNFEGPPRMRIRT